MIEQTTKPALVGESILSFSLERWNSVWRNRHQIMSLLARNNRVLFASPPFYMRDALRYLGGSGAEAVGAKMITENLHDYVPPPWLPTQYRFKRIERATGKVRAWHMRYTMWRLGMKDPILYIWHPSFVDVIDEFEGALVVYHCYDEYASFESDPVVKEQVLAQEREILKRADIVFTASETLRLRRLEFNSNIHSVSNGVNYGLFSQAQKAETVVPDDLARLPRPIVGFVATQTTITDIDLLTQIFTRRGDWSFVFIGLEDIPDELMDERLAAFVRLPNVHIIGRRSQMEIPGYLKGCDVCAVPWLVNDISLSGSPLKLFEYLASGKPVVSSPLSHLRHLDGVIAFANDADEWINAIESALTDAGPATAAERQRIARENTWEQKVEFISGKLAEELHWRRSGGRMSDISGISPIA